MRKAALVVALASAFSLSCTSSEEPDGSAGSSGAGASSGASHSGGSAQAGSGQGGAGAATGGSKSGGSANAGQESGGGGGLGDCGAPPAGNGPTPTVCAAAPAEFAEPARAALDAVNELRSHMGLECMALVAEINVAAQKHCDYYQQNMADEACTGNAHGEVETCPGFVAAMFSQRMTLAGYQGSPRSEVMAFSGDPARAVAMWINSVYHRTPLVSPWIREMGYGGTADCDTVDLGRGPEVSGDATAVYPYPGQLDVPTEFDGSREGPMPPEPASGWPSASPVHLYAQDYTVTSHEVFEGSSCANLPHQWLDDDDDDHYILYPDAPFKPSTTYRVRITGTRGGEPLDFDWTFTTEN
jgi:uncharacterized protein YkwD